jgi:hypothetical protein
MESKLIDGKEYRLVTVRGRSKWVSKDGDLINPRRPNQKVKEYKLNADGYPVTGGAIPVHLFVAYAWVDGYFEGAEVNHLDFDRTNYHADNLEWTTHQQNCVWSSNNYSECRKGSKNGRAKFTEEEIKEIRQMHKNGMSVFDIIRKKENLTNYDDLKRASSTYYYIINNKSWKHI